MSPYPMNGKKVVARYMKSVPIVIRMMNTMISAGVIFFGSIVAPLSRGVRAGCRCPVDGGECFGFGLAYPRQSPE